MADQKSSGAAAPYFVNARDAALALGMSESWFWGAVASGRMPKGVSFGVKARRWELSKVLDAARNFNNAEKAGA